MDKPVYETIGQGYANRRKPDLRWQAAIHQRLAGCGRLLNVGAGSGSYEPESMEVVALEPSAVMLGQRGSGSAPAVQGSAECLPFPDNAFDVAMAILTTHHWSDAGTGLAEMRRVARSLLFVTWDPAIFARQFWLVRDYLPEINAHEQELATLKTILAAVDDEVQVAPLLLPADFQDGVLGAFWRRPEAYLDPGVRAAMSGIALLDAKLVNAAMRRLETDLANGVWQQRNAALQQLTQLDLGYRLVWVPGNG